MIVKVAIDLALDRLFDYEVPEALQEKLAIGQLLSVPFGHRTAMGFAVEIVGAASLPHQEKGNDLPLWGGRDASPTRKIKPVASILDETPFFSPELLTLVRKLAAYTAAPLESMLRAALPAAVLKKNVHAKEMLYVEPTLTSFSDVKVTKRQQWLYEQIIRLGGGWLSRLCRELDTTAATLRTLAEKGLVIVKPHQKRRNPLGNRRILPTKPLPLNEEQRAALAAIIGRDGCPRPSAIQPQREAALQPDCGGEGTRRPTNNSKPPNLQTSKPVLLHGVTGSGKTEVYLQAIAHELAKGRGAIVMVPEIALTPQTVQRFASRFGDQVAVLHSALSDGERYDEWHRIRSGKARVVVGPRSAVFAPVKNLGLIVVDEEHESSYKQEDNPRYHARDAAVLRGVIEGAKVVLGSATPSLESWMNVKRGKYALATMAKRAGAGTLPAIRTVDMMGQRGIFSEELLEAIQLRLDRGEQTILFLNRRGYSRSVTCGQCGHVMACSNCSTADEPLPFTYHKVDDCLRCHICGKWIPTPKACPECGAPDFTYKGIGTQRAEAALKKCFARANVLRMDADSTSRKHSHDDILGAFRRGEADILIGTQMIAKGLDFPNVTLVGVLNADSSLNMPDFRAVERTYQLLSQVAGRAGRAELPGEVVIQTYDPKNDTIRAAVRGDYAAFAERELKNREEGYYPPYCHLATINFRSKDMVLVASWAEMYAVSLKKWCDVISANGRVACPHATAIEVQRSDALRCDCGRQGTAGPPLIPFFLVSDAIPSALDKAEGWYRWQIVLRAPTTAMIVAAWRWIYAQRPPKKDLIITIDADAHNFV